MTTPYPLTEQEWRIHKAATRHRKHLERLAEADDASADAWLAAVDRDDRTDPYEKGAERLPAAVGGARESAIGREQAMLQAVANTEPREATV